MRIGCGNNLESPVFGHSLGRWNVGTMLCSKEYFIVKLILDKINNFIYLYIFTTPLSHATNIFKNLAGTL